MTYGDVRDVIAEVLRNAAFVVRTAANGLEGLLAAHEMRPAVIVMDLTMPVLDGITATRLIKANNATREAQVIAYTADSVLDGSLVESLFTAVVQSQRLQLHSSRQFSTWRLLRHRVGDL